MGNENSSTCTCYDHEAERVKQESNIFNQRIKKMEKPIKVKEKLDQFDEYESVIA